MSLKNIDYEYKVKNIVGTSRITTVDAELDLENLIEKFEGLDLEQIELLEKQPGIQVTKEEGDPEIIIYQSGNYMIVGAKTMEKIKKMNDWLIEKMDDFNYLESREVAIEHFSIENVLVMAILSHKINLVNLCENGLNKKKTSYSPEEFPAVFYRSDNYPCTFSIFKQGKIISVGSDSLTGCTDSLKEFIEEELQELLDNNTDILLEKKDEVSGTVTIDDLKKVSETLGLRENTEDEEEEKEEEEAN